MFAVTVFYVASFLPGVSQQVRTCGPLAVFVALGIPSVLTTLEDVLRLDIHFLMNAAAFASALIGHAREGALLLLLFTLSGWVEDKLSQRARSSLDALSRMSPQIARKLPPGASSLGTAGSGVEVPAAELEAGDRIVVRAGEVVPTDSEVLEGISQVSLDHLTGEPLPLTVGVGDEVMSGALSVDGALLLRVLRPAHESTIQKIGRLAASAASSRPRVVTLLDAVAQRWSYAVVASTAAIALAPPLLWRAEVGPSLYRALVWLITASPCALILATPLVYVSALSVAAASGVLIKGGRTIDSLAMANGVAFDKTGTLTTGRPTLVHVESLTGDAGSAAESPAAARRRGLGTAGALGQLSVHPVSKALASAAHAEGLSAEVLDFQMAAGSGVSGIITLPGEEANPFEAILGRPAFVAEHLERARGGAQLAEQVRAATASNATVPSDARGGQVVVALGLQPASGVAAAHAEGAAWLFYLEDRIKSVAPKVLSDIAPVGPLYMLTGDCRANAESAVRQLEGAGHSFAGVEADLRPEEKLARVQDLDGRLAAIARESTSLQARLLRMLGVSMGGLVMVGDGVNDAPALAAATAGISLASQAGGALSASAVEGADVLVLHQARDPDGDEDLVRVAWVLALARSARRLVQQNVILALGSISIASVLTLTCNLPLWLGVVLHEGATILVALNSLRLFSHLRVSPLARWRSPLRSR